MQSRNKNANDLGIVLKKTIGNYLVQVGDRTISCSLSSRLHKQPVYPGADSRSLRRTLGDVKGIDHSNPVAVGDQVRYIEAQNGTGLIIEVLPRRNRLARRSAVPMPGAHAFEQVIAANIDQVVPVFSASNPVPNWNMLDRYLVSAGSFNLPALVCITKADLVQSNGNGLDEELNHTVEDYRRIGYPVILTSIISGQGLDEFRLVLQGRISVLVGKSGVGKTSLLNALQPGLGLRVNEVSRVTHKGKHTTAHMEMFPLKFGGAIVDTPGTREFGLWDVGQEDLALLFPEIRLYVGHCKFGLDCRHEDEPGCAVRKAVMAGQISPRRYQSYLRLREDAQ